MDDYQCVAKLLSCMYLWWYVSNALSGRKSCVFWHSLCVWIGAIGWRSLYKITVPFHSFFLNSSLMFFLPHSNGWSVSLSPPQIPSVPCGTPIAPTSCPLWTTPLELWVLPSEGGFPRYIVCFKWERTGKAFECLTVILYCCPFLALWSNRGACSDWHLCKWMREPLCKCVRGGEY